MPTWSIWNHHPLSTYAIVDRVYIDGTVYYDRIADEGRLDRAHEGEDQPCRGGRRAGAADCGDDAAGTAGRARRAVRRRAGTPRQAPPAPVVRRRRRPAAGARDRADHRDHQRAGSIRSRAPDIEKGTILLRGTKIEALGADVAVPAGRDGRGCGGRRRLSGLHQRAHADGPQRARPARLRRHQRDARHQPAAAHAGGLSRGERRDSRGARQRHHDGRRDARRRHVRRRSRGDGSRRLDLGGSDAQGRTPASPSTSPRLAAAAGAAAAADAAAARRRRSHLRRPEARPRSASRRARAAVRAGPRLRQSRARQDCRLDPRGAGAGGRRRSCR